MVDCNEYQGIPFPPELKQPGEISLGGATLSASAPAMIEKAVVLSTKRLTLRAPVERDRDELVRLANNIEVAKNLVGMPHPYTMDDGRHWISVLSKPAMFKRTFAITDRYTDTFLGGCDYRPVDGNPSHVSIGYWLGQSYWGNGLAAEAAQAVIDHTFSMEDISSVWISVRANNHQSRRVAEKCGFQFVRTGMANSFTISGAVAIDFYSMARSTWESLHAWGTR